MKCLVKVLGHHVPPLVESLHLGIDSVIWLSLSSGVDGQSMIGCLLLSCTTCVEASALVMFLHSFNPFFPIIFYLRVVFECFIR